MGNKGMTEDIQKKALRVLRRFQDICNKYNLEYYAIGGTCLGAIRHRGFIPWDDDIDIAMPYTDYCKFREVCKTELKHPFSLIGPDNCQHYTMIYMKMQDESTCFVEQTVVNYKDRYCGVYIDIFPIFGTPNDEKKRNKLISRNERLKRLNIRLRFPFSEEKTVCGKLYWIANMYKKIILKYNYYTKLQERMLSKNEFNTSEMVIFPWRMRPEKDLRGCYKNVFFYEDFKKSVSVQFEDGYIKVPVGFDRYLTMDFGDYMKLPPKDKQICAHPSAIIDLEKSYREYIDCR